jgi:LysR family nitrogen assimilation transcriptional regulator
VNGLREGTVDIALLCNLTNEKGLVLRPALAEDILLFAAAERRDSPRGRTVNFESLFDLPLIMPSTASGLRKVIDAAAFSSGQHMEPAIEIDSYRQIKRLTARGLGYGLLPAVTLRQDIREATFRSWRVTQPALVRRIFLAYSDERPLPLAARMIGQLAWSILRETVRTKIWDAEWTDDDDPGLYARRTAECSRQALDGVQ